jgi:hypothetical protein
MEETWTTLALVQPMRRREWELRHGDEKVAELRLPAMLGAGSAQVGDRGLTIRARGIFRREHVLADDATGEEVASVRGRTLELRGVERAEWKSLGRGAGYGLVGPDGEPWLRAKVSAGAFRTTGQIEVAPGHDIAVPGLLAAYLLIRKVEEAAAASAATVTAT